MTEHGELWIVGTPASAGVALGPAVVIDHREVAVIENDDPQAAFVAAVTHVSQDLQAMCDAARASGRAEAGDVLEAQALMARDPTRPASPTWSQRRVPSSAPSSWRPGRAT